MGYCRIVCSDNHNNTYNNIYLALKSYSKMLVSYCLHVVCRLRWPDFALAVPSHTEIRIRVRSAFARCRTQGDGGTSRSAVAIGGEMRGG